MAVRDGLPPDVLIRLDSIRLAAQERDRRIRREHPEEYRAMGASPLSSPGAMDEMSRSEVEYWADLFDVDLDDEQSPEDLAVRTSRILSAGR